MSLLKGGSEYFADIDQQILSSSKKVLLQNIEFKEAEFADTEAQKIYSKYKPINSSYNPKYITSSIPPTHSKQLQSQKSVEKDDALPVPKIVLFPSEKIEMEWKQSKKIGPGFANLGNTCFLNSVLQVLTYTAPLVNFVNSDAHKNNCVSVGFCMLCEFQNHLTRVARHSPQNGPIRPMTIIQKLSYISKNFKFGRQEDAHEFLRYLVEALRKSCLSGKTNLDRLSKETTAINQIFGGFFRSQVTCLLCKKESNTYDPMMEVNLDIKEANSVISALKRTIRTERLDGENKYFCERCRKKTPALKKGQIHKAPKILTLQLKRFDFQRLYGGKIAKQVAFDESLDLGPFMTNKSSGCVSYKLYAVLVHSGISCNSGHYYCYVKAANGAWYEMNDSRVSQVGLKTVLHSQAYLLFYANIEKPKSKVAIHNDASITKTPLSVPKKNQNAPQVKDIGISIFGLEPKKSPLVSDRQKVKFSFTASDKAKPDTKIEDKSPKKPDTKIEDKSSAKPPKIERLPSLQAIKKDYESNSSEDEREEIKNEDVIKPTVKENKQINVEATKERLTESAAETNDDQDKSQTEKQKLLFSPPKSANTETLHQRRRKSSVTTPQSNSKFGRWLPIKNLNHTFTPRAIYCRSLSDSAAFAKNKKISKTNAVKPEANEPSDQKSSIDQNAAKQNPWLIEEKKTSEAIPYGPMTPPTNVLNVRKRTTSVTSETGSVNSKTGEWDIHEKDLPGTPIPPYIPERQFAGWSVETNKPKYFRFQSTGHNVFERPRDTEDKKLKEENSNSSASKSSKKKHKNESTDSDNEEESHSLRKRKKRTRNESKHDEDREHLLPKKSRKCDKDSNIERKKKKKKKDKEKSNKDLSDSDKEEYSKRKSKKKPVLIDDGKCSSKKLSRNLRDNEEQEVVDRKKKKKKKSKKHKKSRRESILEDLDEKGNFKEKKDHIGATKSSTRAMPTTTDDIVSPGGDPKTREKGKRQDSSSDNDTEGEDKPLIKPSPKKHVPVKQWDEAPKKVTSWNGSNNTSIVDALLSKKSRVQTWDGESSNIIDSKSKSESKRSRDQWDEEYDQGKTKKVKKHHRVFDKPKENPFQATQNRRNKAKANGH